MTDERLRETERRWRERPSVELLERYLGERLRAGTISRERVAIAAYCGEEAAVGIAGAQLVDETIPPFTLSMLSESELPLERFARGLAAWGSVVPLAILAITSIREHESEWSISAAAEDVRAGLGLATSTLRTPSESAIREARALSDALYTEPDGTPAEPLGTPAADWRRAMSMTLGTAYLAASPDPEQVGRSRSVVSCIVGLANKRLDLRARTFVAAREAVARWALHGELLGSPE